MDGPSAAGAPLGAFSDGRRPTGQEPDVSVSAVAERQTASPELVERAQRGDQPALGQLFDIHYPQVYRYFRYNVAHQEDAEDLAQEVCIRMLNALERYQQRGLSFNAWVMQIAVNLRNDFYRKKGATAPEWGGDIDELEVAASDDPAASVQQALEFEEVMNALQDLTVNEREVILLRYTADLSIAETAVACGKSENNVKQLTFKALAKLRRILAAKDAKVSKA
jgi:RNA polymerase sigma-70 factor (ECF subfamily)